MNLVSSTNTNTNTNTNIGIGSSLFEIKIKINTTFVFKPSFFSLSSSSSLKFKCPSSSSSFHLRLPSSSKQTMPPTNDDTFDEEEEDDQDDEDEDIFVPLSKMRQWSRNKPRGFGEGKVYDTSLEDKLLQQLDAAANPIPNSPKPKPKQGGEVVPNGVIRVRLFNLPKKKNIHRDLQAAFKGFPGIINILPAVSGNLKTRDPLCKGFAFLHFNSHNQANRFVDMVSTQPITFGKVQKQIRCEIIKQPSSVEIIETPLPVLNATTAPVTETPLDPSVQDDLVSPTHDDFAQQMVTLTEKGKKMVTLTEKGKKKTTRPSEKKVENTPKLNIPPGSANRLKMKEKALLSGVFSKYGGRQSSD